MIGKHLKDYKKAFNKKEYKVNSDWKKRWLPFIKYDHDFDGEFLIRIMVQKLHIMLDFYEHGKYCIQADESRLEIVESLREACRLGDLILEDKFNYPAYEIMEKHHRMWTEPCEDENFKGCSTVKMEWDSPEAEAEYKRLLEIGDKERDETIDKFFDYIKENFYHWCD